MCYYKLSLNIKDEWWNCYLLPKNRERILNRAKEYYDNNKDRMRNQARYKYRKVSEKEKNIKREYGRNRYHHIFKEYKQRIKEYQKKLLWSKKVNIYIVN